MSAGLIVTKEPGKHAVLNGHPWLRGQSIQSNSADLTDGQEVEVVDRDGNFLARGIYNSSSYIKVRLYTRQAGQKLDEDFWRSRFKLAIDLRRDLQMLDPEGACRLVFSESDQLSGLIVDRYANHVVMSLTAQATQSRWQMLAKVLQETFSDFPLASLTVRTDPNMMGNEQMEAVDQTVGGVLPESPIEIVENALRFQVNIRDGQKTGFYLDQRYNRQRFAALAHGRVLDVCCYSGGFAIAAAASEKVTHVTAVDSSLPALELAQTHADLNQCREIDFVKADCFDYLTHLKQSGVKFDSIVLDPPKFAGRRQDVDSALNAYTRLNRLALEVINPGGLLVTCSCSGRVFPEEFVQAVTVAGRKAGRDLQVLFQSGASPDHPVLLSSPESQYLKCVFCRVL